MSRTGATRRKIEEFLRDVLKVPISQGGIQNVIDRTSSAIEPHYDLIGSGVRECHAANIDETSWRIFGPLGKVLHWLWVMTVSQLAFFMVDDHRF